MIENFGIGIDIVDINRFRGAFYERNSSYSPLYVKLS